MGNCLDSESAHDDISLLRESNSNTQRDNSEQLGHSYHVIDLLIDILSKCLISLIKNIKFNFIFFFNFENLGKCTT